MIAIIGTLVNQKPMLLCVISDDIKKNISAKEVISSLASIIDGGGGGKDSMATAGGKNPNKLEDALKSAYNLIEESLNAKS